MVGTSLGPYKILEQLGAGGMGLVYLGEDTRLGRKVAIKVLPSGFASDPERLARFEQEARAAAALSHPHIAVVHDVGAEVGDDGKATHFMVQEYLEGQSLREKLDKGALSLGQALDLTIEVGEALIVAHKAGIVHRDLKPDNIFVTEEGHAKVLDFGLAKLMEVAAPAGGEASMSPTMLGTSAGQVMGTAGYMAPEQINGVAVDHRADFFAFGCVLYESVTGQRPFAGDSLVQTLSKIAHEEPRPLVEVGTALPAELQRIVAKCLRKEPSRRYQGAEDLTVDLRALQAAVEAGSLPTTAASDESASVAGSEAATSDAGRRAISPPLAAVIAVVAVMLGALAGWRLAPSESTAPNPVQRTRIDLPEGTHLQPGQNRVVIVSPDGQTVVFAANDGTTWRLYRRRMNELTATPIPGTEGASGPFFSPDGERLGFGILAEMTIKSVSLSGTDVTTVCEDCRYGSWTEDDHILFSDEQSVWRVPALGGSRELVLPPMSERGVVALLRPKMLPGGRAVLFEMRAAGGRFAGIGVASLESEQLITVSEDGSDPFYASSGHIVFARGNDLFAVAFDIDDFRLVSDPTRVVENVHVENGGAAQAHVSLGGLLVYAPAATANGTRLTWVDRDGSEEPVIEPWRVYRTPRISPDGGRIAVVIDERGGADIHVVELASNTLQQVTYTTGAADPLWVDDARLLFGTGSAGAFSIQSVRLDRGVDDEPLLTADQPLAPEGWIIEDGDRLVFREGDSDQSPRLYHVAPDQDPERLSPSDTNETGATVSHDGNWLAYVVARDGSTEVWARPYPGPGAAAKISEDQGKAPRWGPDDTEIFYLTRGPANSLMVATVRTDPDFAVLRRDRLFNSAPYWGPNLGPSYDVRPDGQRFVFLKMPSGEDAVQHINVVTNWFEELKERVPTGR